MDLVASTSLPIVLATMSTPSNFPTGIDNVARLPGTPPPWANYFIFFDEQGELQFNPPRGSQALKVALEWQFPEEQNYVGRLRKAIELHYESVHDLTPSANRLGTTVFDPLQQASPAASGYSTPTSGFSAMSGRRKRGKRDTSCKYHYDKHLRVEPPQKTTLCTYLADIWNSVIPQLAPATS